MPNTADEERRINAIRFLSIDAVQKANSGHPGLPLGAAAMAYALFTRHLRFDAQEPLWPDRDRFILSAGHGSALLYSLLYLNGYDLTLDDLEQFRQLGSKTPGHPEVHHTPGVEATTGPLGQGISNAVGFAIAEAHVAAMYNRDQRIVDHHTYVLAGDGDLMEGDLRRGVVAGRPPRARQADRALRRQQDLAGRADRRHVYRRRCQALRGVRLAHAVRSTRRTATTSRRSTPRSRPPSRSPKPSLILVRTHIGYGSPRQDTYLAHGEPLGPDDVATTKEKFGWPLEPDFYVPDDVLAWWRENGKRGADLVAKWKAALRDVEVRQSRSRGAVRADRRPAPPRPACPGPRSTRRTAASRRATRAAPS